MNRKRERHPLADQQEHAGVEAGEATGQVPVGHVREEQLLPEEQAATDHEPYGATDLPGREKRPRRR